MTVAATRSHTTRYPTLLYPAALSLLPLDRARRPGVHVVDDALDAGALKYAWLNQHLFVAEGRLTGKDQIEYRVYRVT
jgi:Protein of unknown function (DUF3237)